MRTGYSAGLGMLAMVLTLAAAPLVAVPPVPQQTAQPAAGPVESIAAHPRVADAITLLDLWIEEQVAFQQLPGLAIGIVYDGELIWTKGYGYSDVASKTPTTPATLYRIGSITKLFTATAVMQLRDAGKLRLDDPVAQHLPWFKIQSAFEEAPEITVRHLLTHTAGLPREAAFPYWTTHEFPSREEVREALPGQSAIYPPADRYKYSNLGMTLLGEIVAEVSGMPYAEYVARHLFAPLGMTSTTAAPTEEHHRRRATSYLRRMPDGSRATFDYYDTEAIGPAANIVSSVEDLARFAAFHLGDGRAGGEETVLKGSTLREMQRPHWVYSSWAGGRGLGFGISQRKGTTIVSHGGWIGGNRSHLLLVPSQDLGVVAITNADDGNPYFFSSEAFDTIGRAIAAATAIEPEPKRVDPAWERYVGLYSDPWGWEYEVLLLDEGLVVYSHDYPPSEDAEDGVSRLEPVAEGSFRMSDGELLTFELDEAGQVERIQRRYEYLYPVTP